jgi:hypothetical protein
VFQDFEAKVLGVVDSNKKLDRRQTYWISGLAASLLLTWIIGFCAIKYKWIEQKGVESGLQRTDADTKTDRELTDERSKSGSSIK